MTPQTFKISWTYPDEPLSPLSSSRLIQFDLLPTTKDFLTIAGLPSFASPFLSFVNDTDDIVNGINKLTNQYDFEDEKTEYEKYVVIGSCRDGDPIAINTSKNDQIEELDHGNHFSSMFFNSTINVLADFLVIYKEFENSVLSEHGEEGYQNCYFTDIQFAIMRQRMLEADSLALTEKGFWKEELEIMLSLRQDYLNKA